MSLLTNLQLMSQYNQWMNEKLYQTASQLDSAELKRDRGAFFGSILNSLNHIYVADIIWLRRFANHPHQYVTLAELPTLPNYTVLSQTVAEDLKTMENIRQTLDKMIVSFCLEIEDCDLETNLKYRDTKGNLYQKNFGQLVHNLFNHQTHHRGQITTLLNQQGLEVGVTDWLAILPEQS